ncbi:MAG: zinc-binding dehydrogenase [Oceanococcus sp.]
MRAIRLEKHGAPAVFALRDVDKPEPEPGEVRIRVAAAGVNFADVLARQGLYPGCPPLPCTLGYEVAGEIDALGAGVDKGLLGQKVMALTDFGGYAEYSCVAAPYVWAIPDGMDMIQAAAIPLNYLTAWGLLRAMGSLQSGSQVLIHNAGGGVGLAAIDIALARGAEILATASESKHARLLDRGVTHLVDYRQSDWVRRVQGLVPQGFDLILDPIGGAHWKLSQSLLAPTGRLGMYGISSASAPGVFGKLNLFKLFLSAPIFHPARLIPGNQGVFGINIHAMYERTELFDAWMQELLIGWQEGWLRPCVDKVFAFSDIQHAHEWIEQRRNFGKLVLIPD